MPKKTRRILALIQETRFQISPYLLIPAIFAGIALLCILVAYHVTRYYCSEGMAAEWPLAFWSTLLILFAFLCGFFIVKFLIDPVRRFVAKTQSLGIVKGDLEVPKPASRADGVDGFSYVFDQVSEILSKVESRELFPEIIGHSQPMRRVFNQILKVAPTDATVLIMGETGSGKELVARSIQQHSRRAKKPFIAINCAAIPQGLLESELFGHEKGAFTGAESRKLGKFEAADGGTIFMDEIGDMPLDTQAKLLRTLQESQIERIGSVTPIRVDVRIIAATNKDLAQMVKDGNFRQDLFFRLNVVTIGLPPLRLRREDIPLLADYFIRHQHKSIDLSPDSVQLLTAYHWPGNVRELKNAIESAAVMAADQIQPIHLPSPINQRRRMDSEALNHRPLGDTLDERLREMEKTMIIDALSRSQGIQVKAAALLGIKERSLWHRIKKFGIETSEFKRPNCDNS
jgi:transcriptional regulator with PAS, ATPase and Fis domain